jgi:hypothetical protein
MSLSEWAGAACGNLLMLNYWKFLETKILNYYTGKKEGLQGCALAFVFLDHMCYNWAVC